MNHFGYICVLMIKALYYSNTNRFSGSFQEIQSPRFQVQHDAKRFVFASADLKIDLVSALLTIQMIEL